MVACDCWTYIPTLGMKNTQIRCNCDFAIIAFDLSCLLFVRVDIHLYMRFRPKMLFISLKEIVNMSSNHFFVIWVQVFYSYNLYMVQLLFFFAFIAFLIHTYAPFLLSVS